MKNVKYQISKLFNEKMPCWFLAFLVNLAAAMLAIVPFLIKNHGYFAMSNDFAAQEIPFNMFMNRTIKSGNVLWNWGIDLGGNFLEAFGFYNVGSVFFLPTLLFPAEMIPRILGWMLILKFAVAGAASGAYFGRHIKNRTIVVMASLLYAFSGFQCCSVVFYHFQDVAALFPLLLIGLEKLVEEKKYGRLALACAINALCNYVFFVGEVLFLIVYYAVKYLIPTIRLKKSGIRVYITPILSCITEGILGTAAAGIILIPSVVGTMSNSRVGNHIPGELWLEMTGVDWMMMIKAFFMPAEPMNSYSSVLSTSWMTNAAYLPMFGMVFVIAYLLTKKDWISNLLKIFFVVAAVPVLNSVFMFFNLDRYRRWYYMLVLLMVLVTAKVAEHPKDYKIKQAAAISAGVLFVYVAITKLVPWNTKIDSVINDERKYFLSLFIGLSGIFFTCLIAWGIRRYQKQCFCIMAGIFSIGTLMLSIFYYRSKPDDTMIDFKMYGNTYAQNVINYLTDVPAILDADILPYRYYIDEGIGYSYYNMGMTNSLPTINSFISTVDSSVTEFYDGMGIGRDVWSAEGDAQIKALLSAKYVISQADLPQYTKIDVIVNNNGQAFCIYENEDALPIGFTYDTYMTRSEFDTLEEEVRSTVMLKTLVVEDEDAEAAAACLKHAGAKLETQAGSEKNREDVIADQKRESSERFIQGDNYFESVITADRQKYAFFSVPYDEAWKARVNGKEAEILKINGLMAVRVEQGRNEIRFDYEYIPWKIGIWCSLSGLVLTIGYMFFFSKEKILCMIKREK